MKKVISFICLLYFATNSYCQKKETTIKKTITSSVHAKIDNLVAENKNGNFQITISDKVKPSDLILIKAIDASFAPTNCKFNSFIANGVKLYLLTWTENTIIKKDLKTEDSTTINTVIYEIVSKKKVYSNYQLTNHITEKVFLDKNKTASENQEKMRREGFEFKLNSDGSITQKSKTEQSTFIYDKGLMIFKKK